MKTTDLSPIVRLVALAILGSAAASAGLDLHPPQQGAGPSPAPPGTREAVWERLHRAGYDYVAIDGDLRAFAYSHVAPTWHRGHRRWSRVARRPEDDRREWREPRRLADREVVLLYVQPDWRNAVKPEQSLLSSPWLNALNRFTAVAAKPSTPTPDPAPVPYVPDWDKLPDHVNYVTVARRPGSESGARLWGHRIRPLRHLANGRWRLQAHESPIVLGEAPENTALTTAAPIAKNAGTIRCPHWAKFVAYANGRVWATENRPTMVLAPGSRVRVSHASWEGRGGQVPATRHIIAFLRGCVDGVATSEEVREFFGQFDGTELTKAFWDRYIPSGANYLVRQSPSRWEAFSHRPVYTGIPDRPWRPNARLPRSSSVEGWGVMSDYVRSVLDDVYPLSRAPLESAIVVRPVPPAEQGEIVDATPGGSRKDPDTTTTTVSAAPRPAEVDPVFPDKPRPISGLTLISKLYKSEDELKAGYYSRLLALGEKNVTVATASGGVIVMSRAELCKTYKVRSVPDNRLRPLCDE